MKLLNQIMILMIIVMIPLISIAAAGNIMTRLPDIYSYEFTKSQVPDEIGLDADAEALAALFSDYLTGSEPEFQIIAEYQGREKEVFTTAEQIGMQNIKKALNIALAIAAGMAAACAAIIYYFIYKRQKERVRNAFKISIGFYAAAWMLLIIAGMTDMGHMLMFDGMFAGGFDAEGVLGMLLTGSFVKTWLLFNVIGSAVIMFIFGTIIYKFTKERRMFVV